MPFMLSWVILQGKAPAADANTAPVQPLLAMYSQQQHVLSKVYTRYINPSRSNKVGRAGAGLQVPSALMLENGEQTSSPSSGGSSSAAAAAGGSHLRSSTDLTMHSSEAVDSVTSKLESDAAPSGVAPDSVDMYRKVQNMHTKAASSSTALARRMASRNVPTPKWHAPWSLMRVTAGHTGAVRCVAVEPENKWFVTGSEDRTVRIWDLASGTLKLTLTGHISTVRGVAVSSRQPYLFSVGEDKTVRCWDLEQNKVIRKYHGHLSGVYCCALHPTLDVLMTGGRDATCRVWDIRTKTQVHTLGGHHDTVASVAVQGSDPQIITGSHDHTVKLWDLAAGKAVQTLTHHKKSVRAIALHPNEFSMATASPDAIKKWRFPEAAFLHNMEGHNSIINSMAVNADGVLVSAGDDGSMRMWDYATGYNFQQWDTVVQPGSLDAEAGVYACAFDQTGTRLITAEADKSIKVYKEDPMSSPDSNPVDMEGWSRSYRRAKRF